MEPGKAGKLWLITWSGYILQLDIKTETLTIIEPDIEIEGRILAFHKDKNGQAWLGTWSNGLYTFDTNKGFRLTHQDRSVAGDGHSLSSDSVSVIYEDKTGAIWVGTYNGLNRISSGSQKGGKAEIEHFYHQGNKPGSLSHNSVHALREDEAALLWIRTANGINSYSRKTGQFNAWEHPHMEINSFESFFSTHTLLIDIAGSIWFSGATGGLARFSFHKNIFDHITHDPEDDNSLIDNNVSNFLKDSSGVLWVGTWHAGLNKRVPGKNGQDATWHLYQHDSNDSSSISSNEIRTIFRDSSGVLWISTEADWSFEILILSLRHLPIIMKRDGLPPGMFGWLSHYTGPKGKLYFLLVWHIVFFS